MSDTFNMNVKGCTVLSILRTRRFNEGYRDYPSSFHSDYEKWNVKDQWSYERGRQFAAATNKTITIKSEKAVRTQAIRVFGDLFRNKAIV